MRTLAARCQLDNPRLYASYHRRATTLELREQLLCLGFITHPHPSLTQIDSQYPSPASGSPCGSAYPDGGTSTKHASIVPASSSNTSRR